MLDFSQALQGGGLGDVVVLRVALFAHHGGQRLHVRDLQVLAERVHVALCVGRKDRVGEVSHVRGQRVLIAVETGVGHALQHGGVQEVGQHRLLNGKHAGVHLRVFRLAEEVEAAPLGLQVAVQVVRHNFEGVRRKQVLIQEVEGPLLFLERHRAVGLRGVLLPDQPTIDVHATHVARGHGRHLRVLAGDAQEGITQLLVRLPGIFVFLEKVSHEVPDELHAPLGVVERLVRHVADHHLRVDGLAGCTHVVGVVAEREFGLSGARQDFVESLLGSIGRVAVLDGPHIIRSGAGRVVLALIDAWGRHVDRGVVHDRADESFLLGD